MVRYRNTHTDFSTFPVFHSTNINIPQLSSDFFTVYLNLHTKMSSDAVRPELGTVPGTMVKPNSIREIPLIDTEIIIFIGRNPLPTPHPPRRRRPQTTSSFPFTTTRRQELIMLVIKNLMVTRCSGFQRINPPYGTWTCPCCEPLGGWGGCCCYLVWQGSWLDKQCWYVRLTLDRLMV